MAWPPITMATQHPDNASVPWWRGDAFVPTQDEIEEVLLLFRELPIDEYMWDWEGKYVDEAVGEKLFSRAHDFFVKNPLGEALHLTFRIPAFEEGKMHRMARAFMNVLSLEDLAREIGLPHAPVTEMFLPLTQSAEQLLAVRAAFRTVAEYHRSIFHANREHDEWLLKHFHVTPLVEDTDSMFGIEKILLPYWREMEREGVLSPERGLRVFLARSDPAMNAGMVPAVLAVKAALSIATGLGEQFGVPVHPIIGTGSLPFRGSVNPLYTEEFLEQYAGVRTYSIQSAFRYDYPQNAVRTALGTIRSTAPTKTVLHVPQEDLQRLKEAVEIFTSFWHPTIEAIAPIINDVAQYVPSRRERLLHIGLFGYSRGVGAVRLPRAIKFTAALYSLGIPPELIATGRGLAAARDRGLLSLIEHYYPAMRADLRHAGKYLNRENLNLLAKRMPIFAEIAAGIRVIEEVLGIALEPEKPRHVIHRNLTSTIYHRLEDERDAEALQHDIVQAGVLRRSLG